MASQVGVVVGLAILQFILFIIYGVLVDPTNPPGPYDQFEWLTLFTVIFCLGYLYLTNIGRAHYGNIVGNWLIMWMLSFELYFLFDTMWTSAYAKKALTPVYSSYILGITNQPMLMFTTAYVNIKGYLKLQDVVVMTIVGLFGFSANQFILFEELEIIDSTGVSVFFFGAILGLAVRVIAVPVKNSPLNKYIEISRDQSMVTLLFLLIFFPVLASRTTYYGSLAAANIFMTVAAALIALVLVHAAMGWKIYFQTMVYCTVGSAMTMMVVPGLIQNEAAPAVIGTALGIVYAYSREFLSKFQGTLNVPDPSLTILLFILPGLVGSIFSAIFIGCYNIPSYNKFPNFPYIKILQHPLSRGGMQLAGLIITFLIALATGAVAGVLIKIMSNVDELDEADLIWSEKEKDNEGSAEPLLSAYNPYTAPPQPPSQASFTEPNPAPST